MGNRESGQDEPALRALTHELQERVKELNCLYEISRVVERAGGTLDSILQETVDVLPRSWEHPEGACARITLDGKEYRSENFVEGQWCQAAALNVNGEQVGRVEVCYVEERPLRDEGPFLHGERRLIDAVAGRLGRVVERVRAQQLLREREQELRERLTHLTRVGVMGEMASSIAHEVNQPLTAIATYAQACHRLVAGGQLGSPEVQSVLQRIADEALRAGGIIHRLKDLVRRRTIRRTECDLNALIRDVEQLASVDARLHDVVLGFELGSDLPPVLADGIQLQQVVLNLIRNAIDAMVDVDPAERHAVVRTRVLADGSIEVSVSDRGCGISEDAQARMFEPFFTTKHAGMGMGLSISRTIVTGHGGRMWYEPNVSGGTTFCFTVPPASEDDYDTA